MNAIVRKCIACVAGLCAAELGARSVVTETVPHYCSEAHTQANCTHEITFVAETRFARTSLLYPSEELENRFMASVVV